MRNGNILVRILPDKGWSRAQYILEMQIVLYDLGKKEIGKYSDKEQPMWKAVETEKLKF